MLNKLDYMSLKSLAMTDRRLITEYLRLKAEDAIRTLKLPKDTDHRQLIEKLYHLNSYQSADISGIKIIDDNWIKGDNSITIRESEVLWQIGDHLHRVDGPAVLEYYNGINILSAWYRYGELHRDDGPARLEYYTNGQIACETWYINGAMHREDGPAEIQYYNGKIRSILWCINGILHREDGPALIRFHENGQLESSTWYVNGDIALGNAYRQRYIDGA